MRSVALCLAIVVALAAAPPVPAAEWGTIVPGTSTMDGVRTQFGRPTRTEPRKVDNYDTISWIYEAAQAPTGMRRLTVDFGILQAGGYRPQVVRTFKLEPKPGVFTRHTVLSGWGRPDRVGKEGQADLFYFTEGLLVVFDGEGWSAVTMIFTPPQPDEPGRRSR